MVVAGTGGEATKHYTVGAAGKKAGDGDGRIPMYCERVVGLPVHDADGNVVGTVCALDDTARDYSDEDRAGLAQLRSDVEAIVRRDPGTLS